MYFKKRCRKAQVSMEYLFVFGFAMLLTLPLIAVYMAQQDNIETDVAVAQSERALKDIVFSAEEVYYMGSGSQKTNTIKFPNRIENIIIEPNFVSFDVRGRSGTITLSQSTQANMSGNLSVYEGELTLIFKNVGGQVEIFEK